MDDNYESRGFSDAPQVLSPTQGVAMKKCPYCRADIEENSEFCEYCGSQIGTPTQVAANVSTPTAATPEGKLKAPLANGSLVCSIIGLAAMSFLFFVPEDLDEFAETLLGFVALGGIALSVVGMVLGIVGSKMIKGSYTAYSDSSKLMVGKILGIVGLALWGVLMTFGVIMILAEEGIEGLLY